MKKPKTSRSGKPRAGGNSRVLIWLSGLTCGALAVAAPGVALLTAALLVPGLIALKLDRAPGRPVARTVLTCGLAGSVRPMLTLLNAGFSAETAAALITDPPVVCLAWSGAAAGWLLTQLAPLAMRGLLEADGMTRLAALRSARDRILAAWKMEEP